jgi:hypothetical protein
LLPRRRKKRMMIRTWMMTMRRRKIEPSGFDLSERKGP